MVLSPTLAAQQVSTYQRFTGNRLALNVVTGGDDAEKRRFGDDVDKSARYRRTGEFLAIVRGGPVSRRILVRRRVLYSVERAKTAYPVTTRPRRSISAARRPRPSRWPPNMPTSTSPGGRHLSRSPRSSSGCVRPPPSTAVPCASACGCTPWPDPPPRSVGAGRGTARRPEPEQVAQAHARYTASVSEGAAADGGADRRGASRCPQLEIAPGLWAGPSLVRDGAGTAAVGSYADVAGVLGRYVDVGASEFHPVPATRRSTRSAMSAPGRTASTDKARRVAFPRCVSTSPWLAGQRSRHCRKCSDARSSMTGDAVDDARRRASGEGSAPDLRRDDPPSHSSPATRSNSPGVTAVSVPPRCGIRRVAGRPPPARTWR